MFDEFHETNKQIRSLHNQIRTNPHSFLPIVEERLAYFSENVYFSKDLPSLGVATVEGPLAVRDLYQYLQALNSVPPLRPSLALQMSAYRHSQDLANNPHLLQHTGSDGSDAEQRTNTYGKWEGHLIEQILFGFRNATEILVNMLIDDGLASRANRRNMMNKGVQYVGIGVCPHPMYGFVCVVLYAKHIEDYNALLVQDPVAQILAQKELADY